MSQADGPERSGTSLREAEQRERSPAQVVLLRHGEPDWNPGGGGSVRDPGLSAFGRAQARAAADAISRHPIDAIYVSPYRRSQETAIPLAEATGIEPITVEGLAEIGIEISGMPSDEVDRYFRELSRRPLRDHWEGWPGAETFYDFHARVTTALTETLARHEMKPIKEHDFTVWSAPERRPSIVIVAHGGTNAVSTTHLLDVRPVPWEWLRFESELAAYTVLQARPLGERGLVWALVNFNELDHLRNAGLR